MKLGRFLKSPVLLALLAIAVFVPVCESSRAADASLLLYKGADRDQRVVAAAKREGSLTLYTTIAEKDVGPLINAFEKKYGIKVNTWRAGTDKVLQRVVTEAQAGRYDVDAVHFGSPEMEALHREKLLQPVASPHFKNLVPGAVPAHHEWAATLLSVWVQAYNTGKVKKEELPKSYEDLLNPRWKGKLGIEAKNQEWFYSVVAQMGEQRGLEFFRKLVATNGISVRKGHSLLNNLVISGEVPLALTVYNYMPESAKRKGAPIDWFAIEPAIARSNGVGIAKHASHPNAALLFYDFMLSDAQNLLVDMDYVPTNTKVKSPLKNMQLKLVDPVVTLDQMDKWTKLFEEIVVKRGSGT